MANRTYKRHLTAADRRAKVIIEACVEAGAEIVSLPDAPRFRYTPHHMIVGGGDRGTSFKPAKEDYGRASPSKRSSVACGSNPLKLKTWSPPRIDANPMYNVGMAGDPPALTRARKAWADGDAAPMRAYLEAEASKRRYEAQKAESAATTQLEFREAA